MAGCGEVLENNSIFREYSEYERATVHGKVLFLYGHWTGQFSSKIFISSCHKFVCFCDYCACNEELANEF
jgi:hypothetical protein